MLLKQSKLFSYCEILSLLNWFKITLLGFVKKRSNFMIYTKMRLFVWWSVFFHQFWLYWNVWKMTSYQFSKLIIYSVDIKYKKRFLFHTGLCDYIEKEPPWTWFIPNFVCQSRKYTDYTNWTYAVAKWLLHSTQ